MGTKIASIALAFIMLVCQGGSVAEQPGEFSKMPVHTELRLEESLEMENTVDDIDICDKIIEDALENKDFLNSYEVNENKQIKEAFNTKDVYIKEHNESSLGEDKNIQMCSKEHSKEFLARASWYGPGFHGRQTANGEVFNENELTAAHKELAFGTKIKVTNLQNGKSIVVKINDRGPYVEGRHLDLSKGAAQKIDMIETGVADVKMEILQ